MNFRTEFNEFLQSEFFLDPTTNINPDRSLIELGIIDSMGLIEISAFLDKHYGVTVDVTELAEGDSASIAKLEQLVLQAAREEI